jgi:hypothetical protein
MLLHHHHAFLSLSRERQTASAFQMMLYFQDLHDFLCSRGHKAYMWYKYARSYHPPLHIFAVSTGLLSAGLFGDGMFWGVLLSAGFLGLGCSGLA